MTSKTICASIALLCGVEVASSLEADGEVGPKCTFYLAKSTIEGAGLGIFTGVSFGEDEYVGFGDPAIPIVDLDFHAGGSQVEEDYHWLPSEYCWKASATGPDMEMEAEETSAFVTGFGSMPNCHFRLKNAAEDHNEYSTAGILRTDPGAGAFTPYHNRRTYTLSAVEAGQELFVDYGTNWFLSRENYMGLIPLPQSYRKATKFMKSVEKFADKLSATLQEHNSQKDESHSFDDVLSDLWDIMIQSPYKSRPLSAIPKSLSVAKRAWEVGIQQTEEEQSIRSLDYLNDHGKCMDYIKPGKSSIPHAGRGAFATRFIPNNGYVSIAPLIHIPDRDVLNMFAETEDEVRDVSQPAGQQLLLSYCFGHTLSSLLLCPYSSGSPYINHNSKSPNAKIVWSEDPVYHNASWLDEPVSFFDNVWHAGLALEYVAIQEINEGDEVTIDYGAEWEIAWVKHIQQWQPPVGANTYLSPELLNGNPLLPIPTHVENNYLIGESIAAWCHFSDRSIEEESHEWHEHDMLGKKYIVRQITERTQLPSEESHVYTLVLSLEGDEDDAHEPEDDYIVKNVPRKALSFYQRNYQSDLFIKGVFRHEMMIPDEIFPDAWKNIA